MNRFWIQSMAVLMLAAVSAGAEDRFWVGTGNWSANANWALTSGGSESTTAPGVNDTAVFDGAGTGNATVDSGYGGMVGAVDIRSGYTGTNTQNRDLSVAGDFDLAAGTWQFTAGNASGLTVGGNMTVDGTVKCQRTSTSGEGTGRVFTVGGNLTIGANGQFDAIGMGFDGKSGPGKDGTRGGGAHGGQGGASRWGTGGVTTYGSITNPVSLGSGQANIGTAGAGQGGGAIHFNVAGTFTHNGLIAVDGVADSVYACGAGGSVWIEAASVSGSGAIRANGATTGNTQGNGGGGRIAVIVTNDVAFGSLTLEAYGGTNHYYGAAGTIYLRNTNDTLGRLIVDNAGRVAVGFGATGVPTTRLPAAQTYAFDSITITNAARFEVITNATLDLAGGRTLAGGGTNTYLVLSGGTLKTGGGLTVTNLWLAQRGTNQWTVDGPLTVASEARITHYRNTDATIQNRLDVRALGALTIDSGAALDVGGMGHPATMGLGTDWASRGGAAHGGQGSKSSWDNYGARRTYGSITNPVTLGSGGSKDTASGGGSILLAVSGTLTNNGLIAADGAAGTQSGGAGGSVRVTTAVLAGSGTIRADGAGSQNQGNGGGGRIAVYVTNATDFGSVAIRAIGGTNHNYAAAGTVFLKYAGQAYGTLVIDNGGNDAFDTVSYPTRTAISSNVTDTVVGDVIVRNKGELGLLDNQSLTVMGSWSNASVFAAAAGSTITLAGTNAATVWGNSTFYNLSITNAGKVVSFEVGKTNTVQAGGTLTFEGAEGDPLVLESTSGGSQWYLTAQAGSFQSIADVAVRDSNASGGEEILAPGETDNGNNDNWNFVGGTVVTWTGASSTDWSNAGNWDTKVPTPLDIVVIPDVSGTSGNNPVLDANRTIAGITNLTGSAMNLNGYNLTVTGNARIAGTIAASGSERLTLQGDADFTGGDLTEASSTVVLNGSATQSLTSGGERFWNLAIDNTAGLVRFTDAFAANGLSITNPAVAVRFDGDFTLRDFSCTGPGTALTFADGTTASVTNLLLRGASGNLITLRSVSGGAWNLRVSAWEAVRYVDVEDSNASGGKTIYAIDSINTSPGSNPNWDFGAWKVWQGASADFLASGNWAPDGVPGSADRLLVDGGYVNAPVLSAATNVARLTVGITGASVLTLNAPLTVGEDAVVGPAGTLTHSANSSTEIYKLDLSAGGDLAVATGGKIDVKGMGFAKGYGPGAGSGNSGASHGGMGVGWGGEGTPGPTYGSITAPITLGSGSGTQGNSPGGGVVRLQVAGRVLLDGAILADGTIVNNNASSGGSVYMTVGRLTGGGAITARGGVTTHTPGGGGRIAVVLTNATAVFSDFTGSILALSGGLGYQGQRPSGAGTVYLRAPGQGLNAGTLRVENGGTTAGETRISALVTDTTVGDVQIRNSGNLAILEGYSLTVGGSWSNSAFFTAYTNSTVEFAGPDSATVWGDTTWENLTIATSGKTVSFEAGATQTVNGTPVFDNGVTLRSTDPGTRWKLTVPGADEQPVGRVSAQDSDASGGKTIIPSGGTDLGNNLNWVFPPAGTLILLR